MWEYFSGIILSVSLNRVKCLAVKIIFLDASNALRFDLSSGWKDMNTFKRGNGISGKNNLVYFENIFTGMCLKVIEKIL